MVEQGTAAQVWAAVAPSTERPDIRALGLKGDDRDDVGCHHAARFLNGGDLMLGHDWLDLTDLGLAQSDLGALATPVGDAVLRTVDRGATGVLIAVDRGAAGVLTVVLIDRLLSDFLLAWPVAGYLRILRQQATRQRTV